MINLIQGQEVKLNARDNQPNEMTIAVNPLNNRYVVTASNISNIYFSSDSGKTWIEKEVKSSYGVYGDPVLRYDENGVLYFVHLAQNKEISRKDKDFYASLDRIVVQVSYDNGKTFDNGHFCGYTKGRMQDKPWITFDTSNNIYVTWTEFDQYGSKDPMKHSRIRFFKTNPEWTDTLTTTISDVEGNCIDDDNTNEGATLAFSDGYLVCSWAAFNQIYIDRSADGGKTWGKDIVAAHQRGGWTLDIPYLYRSNGLPFMVNDSEGDLYIVYAEECDSFSNCTQSRMIVSKDHGITWSKPYSIDVEQPRGKHFSFTPNITFNNNRNRIGVIFYETAYTSSGMFIKSKVRSSPTDRVEFQTQYISPAFPMTGKKVFFGDYIDLVSTRKGFLATWNQPDTQSMAAYMMNITLNGLVKAVHEISSNPFRVFESGKASQMIVYAEFPTISKVEILYKESSTAKFKKLKVRKVVVNHIETDSQWQTEEIYVKTPRKFGNNYYDLILRINGKEYTYNHLYLPVYIDSKLK
ncbi:MAG: exo-alpha-sialidase [Bacteroidetes bacterium]|nr:exo-alpha-sialidase [Bacteroidota bacterium]